MDRFTVSLREEHTEQLDAVKEAADPDGDDEIGTSEAVRRVFDRAAEADELAKKNDELRNRIDELQNQLMAANNRIDATNELVRYVEEEREVVSRRQRREEAKDRAGIVTRTKWALVGMPADLFEQGEESA